MFNHLPALKVREGFIMINLLHQSNRILLQKHLKHHFRGSLTYGPCGLYTNINNSSSSSFHYHTLAFKTSLFCKCVKTQINFGKPNFLENRNSTLSIAQGRCIFFFNQTLFAQPQISVHPNISFPSVREQTEKIASHFQRHLPFGHCN